MKQTRMHQQVSLPPPPPLLLLHCLLYSRLHLHHHRRRNLLPQIQSAETETKVTENIGHLMQKRLAVNLINVNNVNNNSPYNNPIVFSI